MERAKYSAAATTCHSYGTFILNYISKYCEALNLYIVCNLVSLYILVLQKICFYILLAA